MHPRAVVELSELQAHARVVLEASSDGPGGPPPLDPHQEAAVRFAVAAVSTALDLAAMREATSAALDAGLTPEQIVEVQLLVAAVGVHAIHEGIRELRDVLLERGEADIAIPRDDAGRRTLREEHQGSSSYWQRLEVELPGFLEGLLTVSPAAYAAFFDICAMPWRHGTLPALTKELVYLAIDATPTHRYGPGFRLHLGNALRLGASRDQVLRALDVASAAPCHVGVR